MRRLVVAVVALLALAACATQPVAPEKALNYKRIGVLSAMGDDFGIRAVGTTVFGNEARGQTLEIGADDILTEKVKAALASKYEVVDLTRYRAAFLAQPKYWPGQEPVVGSGSRPTAQSVVREMMGTEQLDAYLIVTPGAFSVRNTNQGSGGIGIIKLDQFMRPTEYLLHLGYVITMVDGKDFSYVADMRSIPVDESSRMSTLLTGGIGASRISAPSLPVLPAYWDTPAANRDNIRNVFGTLASQSIPHTLKRAQLIE